MTTEDFKRKLTAILSADVEGYSRLMGEDEDRTVRTLIAYRELMSSFIQKHQGRVVDSPGDNLLAEFGSVTGAVRCAVEIQEELRIRNAVLPENRKMQFRIGINLGDIIEEGDRIYGDGINVAARVEGLADGGGICISGIVYEAIRDKLSMSYDFLGEHNVKNIKKPVRVYRIRMELEAETEIVKEKKARLRTWQRVVLSLVAIIILGSVAIWYFFFRQEPVVSDMEEGPKTIAVLPFDDLSTENDQEYFVNGLTEEILNNLTQIPGLTVIAKTSSFSFKGKDKTIQEIASVLGVDNILEGSVRKAGNALRITAQLVKAVDGSHLWSKTYDKEFKVEEMFSIQEDIANNVADKLKLTLRIGKSLKQLGGTENLEAYELYLVAKGQSTLSNALKTIDAAISLDPHFALAWARKALVHGGIAVFGSANITASMIDAGLQSATKAIELEPNLAASYIALGNIKDLNGDWINAELAYRKALELETESLSGFEEFISAHYRTVGYFKRANEILDEIRQNDPLNQNARAQYMQNFDFLGDTKRAEEEFEHCKELFQDAWLQGDIMISFARLGIDDLVSSDEILIPGRIADVVKKHLDSPREVLAEMHRFYIDRDNLSSVGVIYISLFASYFDDTELAMDAVEEGLRLNTANLFWVWSPLMREVRQTPRFKKFVKKIGLVDYWNEFGWPDLCRPLDNGEFECD